MFCSGKQSRPLYEFVPKATLPNLIIPWRLTSSITLSMCLLSLSMTTAWGSTYNSGRSVLLFLPVHQNELNLLSLTTVVNLSLIKMVLHHHLFLPASLLKVKHHCILQTWFWSFVFMAIRSYSVFFYLCLFGSNTLLIMLTANFLCITYPSAKQMQRVCTCKIKDALGILSSFLIYCGISKSV